MSLHRTDYLVSSHQSQMARQAADARLAHIAASHGSSNQRGNPLGRALTGIVAAIRPVKHAVSPSVTQVANQAAQAASQAAQAASQTGRSAGRSAVAGGSRT
jgi:hypothetical protein